MHTLGYNSLKDNDSMIYAFFILIHKSNIKTAKIIIIQDIANDSKKR
jgi:hypothetical protein